jgi:Tol biopolymer transport system component
VINVTDGAARDMWTVEARAGGAAHPLRAESYTERDARVSPGGRWIAYASEQSGRPEVLVESLSGRRQRIPVSDAGGEQPVWRRDGGELFFVDPQMGALLAVAVIALGMACASAAYVPARHAARIEPATALRTE